MNYPPKLYTDAIAVNRPRDLTSAIAAAVRGLAEEFRRFGVAVKVTVEQVARTLRLAADRAVTIATTWQNDPIRVAGLQGTYLVRAGHLSEDDLIVLVTSILTGEEDGTAYLTPENRELVVASALYGWASQYRGEGPETLVWRRAFGDTHVQVGRAA